MRMRHRRSRGLCDSCLSRHPEGQPCNVDEVREAQERLSEQERTVVGLIKWAHQSRRENDYARRLRAAYEAEPRGKS